MLRQQRAIRKKTNTEHQFTAALQLITFLLYDLPVLRLCEDVLESVSAEHAAAVSLRQGRHVEIIVVDERPR